MRRYIGIGIVVLVVAGAIVGLVAGRDRESAATGAGGGSGAKPARTRGGSAAATGAGGGSGAKPARTRGGSAAGSIGSTAAAEVAPTADGASEAPAAPTTLPDLPTRVVKHARVDLRIRGRALDARLRDARDAAEAAGGYVEQSDESRASASVTLRVPAAAYATVLDRIEQLGRVTARSEQGDDVTAQYTDLDARLRNLRAQEAVLLDLMRQARSIPDSITVQQQLSGVQEQIEQLTGQQRVLDGETTYATIAVALRTGAVPVAPADHRSTLGQAWTDAVGVMLAVAGGIVIVLGAVVPIALLVALGLAAWIAVRRRRPHLGPADA